MSSTNTQENLRLKRICTEEYFLKYFHLSIPTGKISDALLQEAARTTDDYESFEAFLEQYMKAGNVGDMLARLRVHTDLLPLKNIATAISVLLDKGDYIDEEAEEFFSVSADAQALFLCINLLKDAPKEQRRDLFLDSVMNTKSSITQLAYFIDYVGEDHEFIAARGQHTPLFGGERFLSEIDFNKAKNFLFKRISSASVATLVSLPHLIKGWFAFKALGYEHMDRLRDKILKAEDGLLYLVKGLSGYVRSESAYKVERFRRTQLDSLNSVLDKKYDYDELRNMVEIAMKNSKNADLKQIVAEGIKNAFDRQRL